MSKLKILIVEDTQTWSGALIKRLDDQTKFKVELRTEADGAIHLAESESFDVVFIDLDFSGPPAANEIATKLEQPVLEGIGAGAKIRDHRKDAVIVMYSAHIRRGEEQKFQDYDRCSKAGADKILSRAELFTYTARELAENIQTWLQEKKSSSRGEVNAHFTFDSGIRTQAMKETLQPETIESLIVKSVPEMKYFELKALQAGYSGAAILSVRASQNPNFTSSARVIVKLSRSIFALEDELKRRPGLGSYYDAGAVVPHAQPIIECDGFYAICVREVRERKLLREFLRQPSKKTDHSHLSRIVKELLVVPAQEARPWNEFNIDVSAYQFKASACSEVVDFLSDAATWKSIINKTDTQAIKKVQRFVTRVVEGQWGFTVKDRLAARLHGDFHCRNIFAASNQAPLLIDFGRSDIYPRLFDFAALDTDLILSVMDSGRGADYCFQNVEKWFLRIAKSFPYLETPSKMTPNTKVELLRSILLTQMTSKLKSVSQAEYGELVMFHMLRYLRFQNIPPAKKILAVRVIAALAKQLCLV